MVFCDSNPFLLESIVLHVIVLMPYETIFPIGMVFVMGKLYKMSLCAKFEIFAPMDT